MDSNDTVTFTKEQKQLAIAMGWTAPVLTIPVPQPGHAINYSLFSQYGLISVDNIHKHTLTYNNMIC